MLQDDFFKPDRTVGLELYFYEVAVDE